MRNSKNPVMKRLMASMLALMMAVGLAGSLMTPAFAVEDPTHDVTGTFLGDAGTPVYSYAYSWGNMKLNYAGPSDGTWNPETHKYEGDPTQGGWTCADGADTITIQNHSNAEIRVSLRFDSAYEGFKGGFSENNFTIQSAVGTEPENAPSKTVRFGPTNDSGVLKTGDTDVKLGTITIHVTGA